MGKRSRKKNPAPVVTPAAEEDVAVTESYVSAEREYTLHVLSNEPQAWKYDLLQMLLEGVMNNQIGYMDAFNTATGKVDRLLVGLEPNVATGLFDAFPLARMLDDDEISKYLAPDGHGNWNGNVPETTPS